MNGDIRTCLKRAMGDYFARLKEAWEKAGCGLPRVCWDEDVTPGVYVGQPDQNEWIAWEPREKTVEHDLAAIQELLDGPLHPTVEAYFNTWWFAALEGRLDDYTISLEPVLPGIELRAMLMNARGYAARHGGRARRLPIGIEMNGLQIVVDSHTGEVQIEDWERGSYETIATNLVDLMERLQP